MRVLVLGGGGFIGRHAARALRARGHAVQIGSRRAHRTDARLGALCDVPRVAVQFTRLCTAPAWAPLVAGADVVLNCVGILRPRLRETYDVVHHQAVAALARACRERASPLVHVSALGLSPAACSGFIRSKWLGEQALLASGADVAIVRPSLLDGPDGFGSRWLRRAAAWPVWCVPHEARGRVAPLDVDDLGDALAALCERPARGAAIYELGGAEVRTMPEHLAALRRALRSDAGRTVPLPSWLARAASHACDLLHATPYSFGHLELMRRDNVPARNALPALLGRAPRPVGATALPARPVPRAAPALVP